MLYFEDRYGGLRYDVMGSNGIEYGLDGYVESHAGPLGPAFPGIFDGDWTWPVDVLADGRTAMGPGRWRYRVIDRSVDQRIERHALLVAVKGWRHRTVTRTGVPTLDLSLPTVPAATGPSEHWWLGDDVAVQATLTAWPPEYDEWTVRSFARTADPVAVDGSPASWCALCSEPLTPLRVCRPGSSL